MNCSLFENLKLKYRNKIKDERIQVENCRDFQISLFYHLRSQLRKDKASDLKIHTIGKILHQQRRKLTKKEISYLVFKFTDVFRDQIQE